MSRTRPTIPQDWVELERLEMNSRSALHMTIWGTLLLIFSAGLFSLFAQRFGLSTSWARHTWAAWVIGFLLTFPLHEWLHGLAASWFGAKPRYGMNRAGFMPYFYCTADWTFTRNQFLAISLAPLIGLNLLALVSFFIPGAGPVAFAILLWNTSGAVGDLWFAVRLLSYPSAILVEDQEKASAFYGPPSLKRDPNAPTWWGTLGGGIFMGTSIAFGCIFLAFFLLLIAGAILKVEHFTLSPFLGTELFTLERTEKAMGVEIHQGGIGFVWLTAVAAATLYRLRRLIKR